MRIGVVTSSYPRHDGDAAGNFVAAHVAAMRAAGHDVDVVRAPASPIFDGGAPDALERGGWRPYVDAVRITAQVTAQVTLRARRWDLAVAHWLVPSAIATLPAALLALPSRLPLLAIAHGGDIHTLRRLHLLAPVLYALRARDTKLAFVSSELRDLARAAAPRLGAYIGDSIVQPMGIDVARFSSIAKLRRPAPRPTIAVVARLVPVKGVDVAISAHRMLAAPAELVIAGDGPERARLERLATDGGQRTSIQFLGAVDTTARDELLARADIVVVPSRVLASGRTEGAPMIALEALAAGVPVIASAVGGLRDLATTPGLTLVAPDDPAGLAAAIDRVLAAPPRAGSVDAFDWQHVASRLFAHAGFPQTPRVCEAGEAPFPSASSIGA
jgi:glycosyltransferase involved in cell wall biosynthesis